MALRIQTNIAAMSAHRNLAATDANVSKSLERLSSGYRINRAADDAAGLSISEGFRADVASFKVASRNTTEANALLQVAEGGMEQIGNMLTRLKELATQAASANVGAAERTKINAEGNALISEIDRLANSTKYGSINLLDGTFGAAKAGTQAILTSYYSTGPQVRGMISNMSYLMHFSDAADTAIMTGTTIDAVGAGVSEDNAFQLYIVSGTNKMVIANGTISAGGSATLKETTATSVTATGQAVFANLGITITFTAGAEVASAIGILSTTSPSVSAPQDGTGITLMRTGLTSLSVEGATTGTYTFSVNATANKITLGNGTTTETIDYVAGATHTFSALSISFVLGTDYDDNDLENSTITVASSSSAGNVFQIGAKNDSNNRISLSISGVEAATLNSGLVVDQLDSQSEAQSMLTTIDSAISSLTSARGTIGASMNRLSYAASNLATTIENVQAADSVIRDVDMAAEMTTFTKNQILMQAGTAMLAQANQGPQLILSLLGQ